MTSPSVVISNLKSLVIVIVLAAHSVLAYLIRVGLRGGHFWLPDGPSARAPRRNRQPALGLHALSREPTTGGTAGLRDQVRKLTSPL